MPQIEQPYFGLHQLTKGLYTNGNEFVLDNGMDYVGLYHINPNGQRFTGARPEKTTQLLTVKRFNQTPETLLYNKVTANVNPTYVSPVLIAPIPEMSDYQRGTIQRFFLQKRNSPKNSIIEVDSNQYNSVNTTNKPGINGVIWNRCLINWIISKIPKEDTLYLNTRSINQVLIKFPHINEYLTNKLEYYR